MLNRCGIKWGSLELSIGIFITYYTKYTDKMLEIDALQRIRLLNLQSYLIYVL